MCFGRPRDLGLDADRRQLAPTAPHRVGDVLLALEALLVEHLRDALVELGLEEAERQVLELPLELPDAEPVGERRVDVERLARVGTRSSVRRSSQNQRSVCVRLARRISTTRTSSTMPSTILRSTSFCSLGVPRVATRSW